MRRLGLFRLSPTVFWPGLGLGFGLVLAGAALLSAACAQNVPAAPATPDQQSAGQDALWQQVLAEVGTPTCTADADCRSIAVGAKACGGPTGYLAWSARVSDATRLQQKVDAHAKAQAAAARASGMVSNCMMQADPGAQCKAQRCVLGGQGSPAQ